MPLGNRFKMKLNVKEAENKFIPTVTAGDNNIFEFEVYDGKDPVELSETYRYTFTTKAVGKDSVMRDATLNEEGNVEVVFGYSETQHAGVVDGALQIYDENDKRISTMRMKVNVKGDLAIMGGLPAEDSTLIIADEAQLLRAVAAADDVEAAKGDAESLSARFNEVTSQLADKVSKVNGVVPDANGNVTIEVPEVDTANLATKTELSDKRDKSVPITEIDISDTLRQQITGNAPIAQTIGVRAVSPLKTTFMQRGAQLFNKNSAIPGHYIEVATGNVAVNASYYASDFIPVTGGETYYKAGEQPHKAWYDSNFQYITTPSEITRAITAPSNASYLRISVPADSIDRYMLNAGTSAKPYEDYQEFLDQTYVKDVPVEKLGGKIPKEKTSFFVVGKNKFNKEAATLGHYVVAVDGRVLANAIYHASDFIEVKPNTVYTRSYAHQMAFYDADKMFISGLSTGNTFTTPSNAKYMRLTILNTGLDTFQVELGSATTSYESFRYVIEGMDDEFQSKAQLLAFLPSEICVAVGRTIELYNKQVAWCGNINDYHFKWDCQVGKSMKRKFSVSGTDNTIGNYPLILTIYDNNMNPVFSKTSTVKIVSSAISSTKKILPLGDSLSNSKPWLGELRTLSGEKFEFVGTRGTAPLKHEGRSGFTASQYLTNTNYTFENEGIHAFWDSATSRFNWGVYKTNKNINPDIVQIFLGTNGISLDPTANANSIKQIIDYIRQDDANIPIYVVFTLYRANQDGIGVQTSNDGYSANRGAWKLEEDRKVFNLMVRLNSLLANYTNLHFIPISLCHDSEFNFGAVSTPVNPRASQTESLPVEATHPQSQGYMQMADIMFSVYAAHQ